MEREKAQIRRAHYAVKTHCVSLLFFFFFLGLPLCCLNVYMERLGEGGGGVGSGLGVEDRCTVQEYRLRRRCRTIPRLPG